MINRLLKKAKSTVGESISETLVAVLIGSIALIMLASMITTAKNLVDQSRVKLNAYYSANNALDNRTGSSSLISVSITDVTEYTADERDALSISTVSVNCYSQEVFSSKEMIAYGE